MHFVSTIFILIDKNHSGSNVDRPAFKQMLADIDTGRSEILYWQYIHIMTFRYYNDMSVKRWEEKNGS